jgi:hypothetical protein
MFIGEIVNQNPNDMENYEEVMKIKPKIDYKSHLNLPTSPKLLPINFSGSLVGS